MADAHGGDIRANLRDFAGDVATGNVRQWNGHIGKAAPDPEVEMIQRASLDAHEHFVVANDRVWRVLVFEDVRCTMLMKSDGFQSDAPLPELLGRTILA